MTITICSREDILRLCTRGIPKNAAVISFCDTSLSPVEFPESDRVFRAAVDDLDEDELADMGLDEEGFFPEADALADFIRAAAAEGRDFICQCEYGQGRSAACAAAILEYACHSGISVFADSRFYPNRLIFNKLYSALGGSLAHFSQEQPQICVVFTNGD